MQTNAKTPPHKAGIALSKGEPPSCSHRVPQDLINQLPSLTICPPCYIQYYVDVIKAVQSELEVRGGIFVSRPKQRRQHPEWNNHVSIRDRWRDAKIKILNAVMKFEEIAREQEKRNESTSEDKSTPLITDALQLYEKEKDAIATVPGYGKEMTQEDVTDIVKRMMDQLRGTIEGLIDADGDSAMEDAEGAEEDEPECAFAESDVDLDLDSDEEGVSELGDLESEADEEEGAQATVHDDSGYSSEDSTASTTRKHQLDQDEDEAMDVDQQDSAPSPADSNGRPGKRVRFTDFASVCPDSLVFVPALFPYNTTDITSDAASLQIALSSLNSKPSTTPTLLPHRRRSDADRKRLKARFKHTSGGYHAGKWSSPAGYVKANTSWYKLEPEEMEKQWTDEVREVRKEKKAFKRLQAIAGTWVLMRMLMPALWCFEEYLKRVRDQSQDEGEDTSGA